MAELRKGSYQLIHLLACSQLMHGVEAEVNWYIGGNSYVTMPTAVADSRPGVYLAKAKFIGKKDIPEDDQGPQAAIVSLTGLRWLGARNEFIRMAKKSYSIKYLGKNKHNRLMEMLNCNCEPMEVEEVELNP